MPGKEAALRSRVDTAASLRQSLVDLPGAAVRRSTGEKPPLVLLPLLLVEPSKLVAVAIAGKGHWLAGTGMIIGAYAASSSAWNDFFGRLNRAPDDEMVR
jgi:hypothetical protein